IVPPAYACQSVTRFVLLKSPFGKRSCARIGRATSALTIAVAYDKRLIDCIGSLPYLTAGTGTLRVSCSPPQVAPNRNRGRQRSSFQPGSGECEICLDQRDRILSIQRKRGEAAEKSTFSSGFGRAAEAASRRGRGGRYLLTGR